MLFSCVILNFSDLKNLFRVQQLSMTMKIFDKKVSSIKMKFSLTQLFRVCLNLCYQFYCQGVSKNYVNANFSSDYGYIPGEKKNY